MNETSLQNIAVEFLGKAFIELENNKIDFNDFIEIDHLCWRTNSIEEYNLIKNKFSQFGTCLIESIVGGRPIATYKLNSPIRFKEYTIGLIEVPSPKIGKVTKSGFEHFEIVTNETFDNLEVKYSHLNLDLSGLKKSINKEFEIIFKDFAIKFHHQSLEKVIDDEIRLID